MPNNVSYLSNNNINPAPHQGFGEVTTLIHPFFSQYQYKALNALGNQITVFGIVKQTATSSIDVSEYNNHVLQPSVTGSGNFVSMSVLSSIDGINWNTDFNFNSTSVTSSIFRLAGRRTYLQANITSSGNFTSSLYLLSGQ